ncbi:phage tail length tape measure family protein [Burkholderia gladioli]|uniref:phage tail length tape measure family protein n=1 Tax=Burkholderia gladioli TaxID=28095 RepID=UPI00163F1B74|nr:phage tail length tape measure family protein [Burkholderia gladioli]
MTAELAVALRVLPKLDDARQAVRQLKAELNDLRQSAQSATSVVSSTGGGSTSAPAATANAPQPAPTDTNASSAAAASAATALNQQAQAAQQAASANAQNATAMQGASSAASSLTTTTTTQSQAAAGLAGATDRERQALERLIGSLDPAQTNSLKLKATQDELNAAFSKGFIPVDQYNRLMDLAAKRFTTTGVSAGQTAQAMRQLPAQITDVVTSLASGMPVWLVAIQQGGQIRDSFGGIGAAFRGVLSLINPVTASIAAVAAGFGLLVASVIKGEQETTAFNVAIRTTGNAAGATQSRIEALAKAAHDVSGISESAAQSAAVAMVQSGRLGIETIGNLTKSIEGYAQTTGQDTDKAAASLAKLFVDPKNAVKELDDQFNILTPTQRSYINQLIEQGQTEQAQLQLSQAMADRFGKVLPENLGILQKAWRSVADAAAGAIATMMSLGKQSSLADQIKAAQAEVDRLSNTVATTYDSNVTALTAAAQKRLAALQKQQQDEQKKADDDAAKAAKDRHLKAIKDDFDAQGKALQTNAQKIADERKKLDELVNAGLITPQQSASRLKAFTDHLPKGTNNAGAIASAQTKADLDALKDAFQQSDALIVKALDDGRSSIDAAYQRRIDALHKEIDGERQVLQTELDNPKTSKQRRIEIQAQIKGLDTELEKSTRQIDAEKKKWDLELANITVKLRIDTANLTGQFDRAAVEKQLRLQYAPDLAASFKLADPAGVIAMQQAIETLIQASTAQAEFNAKLEEASRLQSQLGVIEQAINQRAASGQISQIEAQAQINQARAAQVPMLQAIVDQLEKVKDAVPSDAAAAIDKMSTSIGGLKNQVAAATPVVVDLGTQLKNQVVDGAADAAATAITNFENLGQAASTVLKQIAADIIRSDIKRLLTNLFTPDAAAGGSSILGSVWGGVKSIFGFAEGGLIRGPGTGTSDSIPALVGGARPIAVSNNEFIQPERAVQHYGVSFMEAVRTLQLPKPTFAFGGLVSASRNVARYANGGAVAGSTAAPSGVQAVRVEVSNQDTPKRAVSATSSFDGKDTVVRIVLADAASNGPMTRALRGAVTRS